MRTPAQATTPRRAPLVATGGADVMVGAGAMAATEPTPPPQTNIDAALGYARRGWRVIPIPRGRKHPAIPAWQTAGTTDEARIRHWWTTSPDDGIGIVTGPASGVWVLDVDVADGKAGDDTLAELIDSYGELPDTYEVITGSGGRHIYFAWPDGVDVRNSASGVLGPGLDVRGDGGQVLAPPTIHPNGTPYEVEASAPYHVAQAPGWLLRLLTPEAPARPLAAPTGTTPAGDRPGDLWAAQTTWADLLGADGWTLHHVDRDGEEHWTRPGKDRREGTSATVGYRGSDVLKVFTSSIPALRAEETYTKLGYFAATRHHGDHSAAASALRADGWRPTDGGSSLDDLIVGGGAPAVDDTPWPEPRHIEPHDALPPFPVASLPAWAQDHVAAAADAIQVPVDLTATLAIGALVAACTGRAKVHVTVEWYEPMALYLVCALPSGAGKSPAHAKVARWLDDWEAEQIAVVQEAHDRAALKVRHAKKQLAKLEGGMGTEADLFAALDLVAAAEAEVPPLPKVLIDDVTPEAVAGLLAAHDQRLAITSTEADLFDMLLRGKPGQRQNMNIFLKAWSADPFRRDRKGGSESGPESMVLRRPMLSCSVTVQPSVLARVAGDEEMASRGFAYRFMVSMPDNWLGTRDQRRRFQATKLTTTAPYEAMCRALASRWSRWENPADLRMSTESAQLVEDFLVELEPQLAPGEPLERLAEWVNKIYASVIRYAGLLHLAEERAAGDPVDAETTQRAVDLGRYWLAHAHAVMGLAGDKVAEQAQTILSWVAANGSQFTLSDLQTHVRRPGEGLDKVADFVPPVELLIDLGWVRPVDNGDWRANVGVRRAKSPVFALCPSVVGTSPTVAYPRSPRTAYRESAISLPSPTGSHTPLERTRYADSANSPDGLPDHLPVDNALDVILDPDEDLFA